MKSTTVKYFFVFGVIFLTACSAGKKIPYLKDAGNDTVSSAGIPEPRIYKGDQLTIVVNTTTPEAAASFNMMLTPQQFSGTNIQSAQSSLQTYFVDADGSVFFPVIGKIFVNGKTKREVEEEIKNKIYPAYLKEEPIVVIRYINFKISVLGEVTHPGTYTIASEKVSLFEALAMAGDMSLYGRRDNVLLIREDENGKKETVRIDLQDKNLLSSPYYYLKQNDVLYVQVNNARARSAGIGAAETMSVSVTSILISLTSLIVNILK
ncbi:MAG: polysaccharide biosynthesis/export family protein [Prevotellaceae bacterium]|jgi:polysaccharide export outer membrane protein|nr:polysaccharide biosynthesis/export family protein [Prevotellaceae bacterium]